MRFARLVRRARAVVMAAFAVVLAPSLAADDAADCRERAEAEIRDAYRELDRIRGEADALRQELEPYLDWQAANREIDGAQREIDLARDALRRADEALEGPFATRNAENAARARRTRAQRDLDAAQQKQNDAISDRNQQWNDRFSGPDGKRLPREEIERRMKELDDRLEELEQAEREAARRVEEAVRKPCNGDREAPEDALPESLSVQRDAVIRGVTKGAAALDAIADLIAAGDCDRGRFEAARARVREALETLAGVADAAALAATFGDVDSTLQGLGAEARAALDEIATALEALAALWAESCDERPACSVPGGADIEVPAPSGAAPGGAPGGSPAPGGGAPAGKKPEQRVGGIPLAQDLRAQLGLSGQCVGVSAAEQQRWLDELGARAMELFGNRLWFTRLDRDERAVLYLLHRTRLYDLATQIALWNQLLPGSGETPDGNISEAARQGTLPQFVDNQMAGDREADSLIAHGQADTPEFRQARAPFDEQTTELAKEYEARLAAEAEARERFLAVGRSFSNLRGPAPPDMVRRLEEADAELRKARQALDEIRPAVRANPLLHRTVDGRRLSAILADPSTTAEQRQAAIDRAVFYHLIALEVQFRRVRDFDTAEEVAGEVLSPALAPLNGFVATVLQQFCFERAATILRHLNEIYRLNDKDLEIAQLGDDLFFAGSSLAIAGVTLVGVILVPQVAVPILLATTGGADALLAWNEYGIRVERADVAEADLRAVEQRAGAGVLTDAAAVDVAREKFEDAVFQRQLSGAFVVLSSAGATLDSVSGALALYRIADAGGIAAATQHAAWEALAKQRPGWEAFEAQADAARAAGGRLGEEAAQAGIRTVAEVPLTETRTGASSVAPSRGPPAGGGFQDAATEAARRTEAVGPPRRIGDLPTEAAESGGAAAPAAGARVADAGEAFDPLGDLDRLQPPAAGGVAAADEPTRVLKRRPWGDAEADANRRTMLPTASEGDDAAAGAAAATKEIRGAAAAGELKGAQFMVAGPGGEVAIEVGRPVNAGGLGSVLEVEVVASRDVVPGLPAANTGPFRLGADTVQLAPLPTDGRRLVAKLFEKGSHVDDYTGRTVFPGREAVQAELDGAPWFDRAGILYPKIHAVGELPDGTPYVIKELIDVDRMASGPLTAAQQRPIVEGYAGLARAGGVGLDMRAGNGRPILVVHPDGTPEWKMFQWETDFVGDVANPSRRLSEPAAGLDPFHARFDLPWDPRYALAGDARPIQSLMGLGDVPAWFRQDAWVNGIIELERRGEITFDAATKTFGNGALDIVHFRQHPEFGPALAHYEKILQGAAEPGVTVTEAVAAAQRAGARAAAAADAGSSAARSATAAADASAARSSDAVAAAAAGRSAAVSPWFTRFGARITGLAETVAPGTAAAQQAVGLVRGVGRVVKLVLRLDASGGGGGGPGALPTALGIGPFGFMTQSAPSCWTSIEDVVPVPESIGGGWMLGFYTTQPELFDRWLADEPQVDFVEPDKVEKAEVAARVPDDPLYRSRGSWKQAYDDQWGLKRIGFETGERGGTAWSAANEAGAPVIVAVIDSGLDSFHPDFDPANLWRNPLEIANERDDDGNGYVDDLIGWNFVDGTNDPWDDVGHGTHVAGIIAATTGNGRGIAGINPRARILPLKVLDARGRGRASNVAAAVFYAVRHGAHVINLSLGERGISATERLAVEHARRMGVLVVVAAGNAAADTADYGPGGVPGAVTVTALGPDDRRPGFSNLGEAVTLSAPGVEILSLRAEGTDLNAVLGVEGYAPGSAVVGDSGHYYYSSGTSFAAPFVTGVASLLLSRDPTLTVDELERMLAMSAVDVEIPGWDRFTGSGRLDAVAALVADPHWELTARVSAIAPVRTDGGVTLRVRGTVTGSRLRGYRLELGQGEAPATWKPVGRPATGAVVDGVLGEFPASEITAAGQWTVRVVARDANGAEREGRGTLAIR